MSEREFYLLDMRYRPGTERPEREPHHDDDEYEALCGHYRGRHWHSSAPLMVFWGPKGSGYANSLAWSGRYKESKLRAGRFGLGEHTMAVPCEVVERMAIVKPDPSDKGFWCDGPGPIVPNHSLIWDILERSAWAPTTEGA